MKKILSFVLLFSCVALGACSSPYDGHYGPNYYADHNDDAPHSPS